jgi:hypothetical protein
MAGSLLGGYGGYLGAFCAGTICRIGEGDGVSYLAPKPSLVSRLRRPAPRRRGLVVVNRLSTVRRKLRRAGLIDGGQGV